MSFYFKHAFYLLKCVPAVKGDRWLLLGSLLLLSPLSHILSPLSQTNIGSILAAVNPYKQIPGLYDPAAVDLYSRHHLGELPPHIFAVANECYRCLWKRHDSQCVLIRSVRQGLGDIALTRSYCSHRRLDSNT